MNWRAELLSDGNVLIVMDAKNKQYRWTATPHVLWSLISLGFIEGYLDSSDVSLEIVDTVRDVED